jgi:cytochrome c peroxidase
VRIRAFVAALVLAGCPKGDKTKTIEPAAKHDAQQSRLLPDDDSGLALVLPPAPPIPKPPAGLPPLPNRPELAAITADQVALGELLFYDPRLSSDGKLACASCHDPAHGYSGGNDKTSRGKPNLRRTPALVNLAWMKEFGWDGRYPSLAEQLASHIRGQLGEGLDVALPRIADVPIYRAHFARIGGAPQDAALHAIAALTLTRYEGDSAWDKRERNPSPGAAPDSVTLGYRLFIGKAQCAVCHTPPLYTDLAYHRVATNVFSDPGRGHVDPAQSGAFKTPTLRGAAARVAFFHSGAETSLENVVAWYTSRGDAKDLDPILAKIRLSAAEAHDLLAFVRELSSSSPPPRPVLP